jgi:thiaminase/transcriptional activator TenA
MHRQLSFRPLEIAMASLLPCFWIYKEVGDYILAKAKTEANPYQSWIDTYGGEEYASSVTLAVNLTDKLAQGVTESLKEEMTQSFVLTSKMEWMFWDSAYKLEKWPV